MPVIGTNVPIHFQPPFFGSVSFTWFTPARRRIFVGARYQ